MHVVGGAGGGKCTLLGGRRREVHVVGGLGEGSAHCWGAGGGKLGAERHPGEFLTLP